MSFAAGTLPSSAPSRLPVEIAIAIADACSQSRSSLNALAVTSRAWQSLVEPCIWRDLHCTKAQFPDDLAEKLQLLRRGITSRPTRASFVHTLSVDVGGAFSLVELLRGRLQNEEVRLQTLSTAFCSALACMDKLGRLELWTGGSYYGASILSDLSTFAATRRFDFRLRILVVDIGFLSVLRAFLLSQPSLLSIRFLEEREGWVRWSPWGRLRVAPETISAITLPRLTNLACEAHNLGVLTAGRPVESISTKSFDPHQVEFLPYALEHSLRPITYLDLTFRLSGLLDDALRKVAGAVWSGPGEQNRSSNGSQPSRGCSVQTLVLKSSDKISINIPNGPESDTSSVQQQPLIKTLQTLARFTDLRLVRFGGSFKELVRFDPTLYAGPQLAEVQGSIMEPDGADRPVHRVHRDDGWSELETID